jgi:alkylation response protein AidB-like acyl-CoA dehydrogenase
MFELTKEQKEKKRLGADFAKKLFQSKPIKTRSGAMSWSADTFSYLWRKFSEFGIFMLPIPRKYGGLEENILDIVALMEGIGSESPGTGILFSLNVHLWACEVPILYFGTEAQKTGLLPELMSGETIGAHAISEPGAGSDAWNLETTYQKTGEAYLLNGTKNFVTNAPVADIFLIYARDQAEKTVKNLKKIACFIVRKNTEGFTIGKPMEKMGLQDSPLSAVYLNDCLVPAENLLGQIGQGTNIFNLTMEYERTFLFSFQIGFMEKQLKDCVRYAKTREQFKNKIIRYQSISNRLADMKVRLEISRLLMYKIAHEKMKHKNVYLDSSIAKLYISESLVQNSMNAMEIYGGYGYMKEYGVEEHLRDAMASKFYSGTADIQRNIIAGFL